MPETRDHDAPIRLLTMGETRTQLDRGSAEGAHVAHMVIAHRPNFDRRWVPRGDGTEAPPRERQV
jgi:hypothetical protein